MDPETISAEMQRHQAAMAASFVRSKYRDDQRALWTTILDMVVHDIVEFHDGNDDDVIMTVYRPAKNRDLNEDDVGVAQVLILEQNTIRVWFTKYTFKGGSLIDGAGDKIIPKLQQSAYNIL